MSQLKRLVYVSRVARHVRIEDATAIAQYSAKRNALDHVTGGLLYTPGMFIQVLEGEPAVVDTTYARIARDDRHHDLQKLDDAPIEARKFGDWSMGFAFLQSVFEGDGNEDPTTWNLDRLLERIHRAVQ